MIRSLIIFFILTSFTFGNDQSEIDSREDESLEGRSPSPEDEDLIYEDAFDEQFNFQGEDIFEDQNREELEDEESLEPYEEEL